jgi:hypothetical protein
MAPPSGFRYQTFEDPQDDFGVDEEFLRQVVAPTPAPAPAPAPAPVAAPVPAPGDWMSALQQQNPNWILQAIQSQPASLETGEAAGPIEGYTFYDPSKTSTNDTFKRYDVSGNLLGEQKFKTPGDIADLAIEAGVDLAPILQYTPLGPAVKAIAAINAAKEGDLLPAIASAAGFGGYENVAKAAQAASALKNEDYLGAILPALQASGIKDIGGYGQEEIGKVLNVARAIDKGPIALISAAAKFAPTPDSQTAAGGGAEMGGFFDSEEAQAVQDDIDSILARYPETTSFFPEFDHPLLTAEPEPTPISAPERMAFLEANIAEPETVQQLMQQYYPEIYETAPVDNEMAKLMRQQELAQAGESALGGIGPNAKELPLINLSGAPALAPGKAPAAPAKKQDDLGLLMALSGWMTPQQQEKDDYQLAQIGVASPYGIYGA